MEKTELDFGGDLSEARNTGWLNKTGTPRVCVAIGVPAGVVGTIGILESAHGRAGVTGTPYATQIPTANQPAGGAAYRLVLDVETPAPFVEFTWTPGEGNDGTDKEFTDDSLAAGTKPLMVPA